eukprot:363312-Chlamydomonas_euryale.AAC.7
MTHPSQRTDFCCALDFGAAAPPLLTAPAATRGARQATYSCLIGHMPRAICSSTLRRGLVAAAAAGEAAAGADGGTGSAAVCDIVGGAEGAGAEAGGVHKRGHGAMPAPCMRRGARPHNKTQV